MGELSYLRMNNSNNEHYCYLNAQYGDINPASLYHDVQLITKVKLLVSPTGSFLFLGIP